MAVQPLERKARESYAENIQFGNDEFVEMLVLDGCFIIELFRKIGGVVPVEKDDPLISLSWVYSFFLRDFIRLENQIPFFVLERLFDVTKMPDEESGPSFPTLALQFFNNALQRPENVIAKYSNLQGKHLLDFLRSSFLPVDPDESVKPYTNPPGRMVRYISKLHRTSTANPDSKPPTHVIQCISKLRRAGIKLRPDEADSFLIIKFNHGVISMPTVTIDDFMSAFLINCVAYEQCYSHCSKHVTAYATLLDCLINTSRDVEYLCEKNIIENYFGTDAEIARFINNLGKDITFDIDSCNLTGLFDEVNRHYQSGWHVQWASFRYTYFDTPWSFISALAAFVLLVLTVAQTVYTVLGYTNPPA